MAKQPQEEAPELRIEITDKAREMILSIMAQEGRTGDALRVTAHRGGPAGVVYGLAFAGDEDVSEDDKIVLSDGIRLVADPIAVPLLEGASIDYIEGQWESGFKIEGPVPPEPKPEGPIAEAVMRVIAERINPAVASHGGHVSLVDVQDTTVFLRLGGGCQGCGMVDVTLKQGIEVLIKEEVPEVTEIFDVTDHAGGRNPYYQPSK